jgi:hypothetical protein
MKICINIMILFIFAQCKEAVKSKTITAPLVAATDTISAPPPLEEKKKVADFVPDGFTIFQEIKGDLNKDGSNDIVLIIKATKKEDFVKVDDDVLDRNRRGLIVLLAKNGSYKLALQNKTCFSSEFEEGGVYYAPELMVYIENAKLFVHYAHGRYGYWKYMFRLNENSDFDLIGYDASDNRGPVINNLTSINYLSGKKQIKTNTNNEAQSGEEIFEEKWENLESKKRVKLSEIIDFDDL